MVETIETLTEVPTYTADIYVGLREGYTPNERPWEQVGAHLIAYTDKNPLCVSYHPIHYIYHVGFESGVKITLINYPRFPSTKETIEKHAIAIARMLKREFKQIRVSIVMTDKTIMLEERD
jgi:hypothetical protein